MSNIIPFVFDEQAIRTTADEHGDSWFFAVDVCAALGIANARDALIKLDDDEKSQVIDPDTVGLTDGTGINNLVGVVNESGLYTLILRCRNATKAGTAPHRFRKWVTSEVLPALRKIFRVFLAIFCASIIYAAWWFVVYVLLTANGLVFTNLLANYVHRYYN